MDCCEMESMQKPSIAYSILWAIQWKIELNGKQYERMYPYEEKF